MTLTLSDFALHVFIQVYDSQGWRKWVFIEVIKLSGLSKQGSDALYAGHGTGDFGIDKGHLNPCFINSYNVGYMAATFTYANAVPQFGKGSNRASWKTFENRIAIYTKEKCANNGGTMYMLTGTSKYRLEVGALGQLTQVQEKVG